MAKSTKPEQRKRMMLMILGGLLAIVVIYNLLIGPSKPTRKPSNVNAAALATQPPGASPTGAGQTQKPKPTGQPEEIVNLLMADLTPLDLPSRASASGAVDLDKERGPVFAYYVAPPPPPVKPPDPPPITLTGVSPASAVAGTPRKITLTIVGSMIPVDAQLLFDNSLKPSRRLNDHQIATDLEPAEYASQRTISITLKSASDPKMFSTATNFSVQAAPEPQFRYVGRLGEQALFELPAGANKEYKRLGRGEVLMNQWRIDAITDQGVDLTHTQYEIKRRVPLSEKTR